MSSIKLPDLGDKNEKKSSGPRIVKDLPGQISSLLGTGNNAKDSIVYSVLRWCFWIGSIFSILLIYNSWMFRENEKVPDVVGDLESMWKILTPIITLALGYLFGKNRSK